ncbi:hypothetical protein ASPFODRAFT_39662 [Aspergillus luchuensis CBS 106.47]|uniref:Uncharacterized protein n=1 Tax=Aspergillus luchuensis (strain CBS 106.47) TaxID=1137211 RepID=A0A1M3TZY7_ASPLC|nr:hypothetical protein ASPFODRAFT_39662 [Aspergillus luchuensis CBS 106.47]
MNKSHPSLPTAIHQSFSNHASNTYPNKQERTPQAQTHLQQTNKHPYIIKKAQAQAQAIRRNPHSEQVPKAKQTPCMHSHSLIPPLAPTTRLSNLVHTSYSVDPKWIITL